jgi:predicted transglutaminase-like cysteine proteinase
MAGYGLKLAVMMTVLGVGGSKCAWAIGPDASMRSLNKSIQKLHIKERQPTLAPMGHVIFCQKHPNQCRPAGTKLVSLTDKKRQELYTVNASINQKIRAVHERKTGGFSDNWAIVQRSGDCEDFALTKRAELIRRGWPASALRIAVGTTYAGEGHAVLIVRTNEGDLVLDNLAPNIRHWKEAPIRWIKIQSGTNPKRWHKI